MSVAESNGFVRATSAPPRYPINLRITIPFFPTRIFLTLIVGSEKREKSRRRAERALHPIDSLGNLMAVIGTLSVLSVAALFAALVVSGL